jgi:HK97 family phage prohead protease
MIQYKDLNDDDSVMDVDMVKRTAKVVWSRMFNKDLDEDIIVPEAYTKTIAECGPNGKNMIWSLVDHNASFKNVLGKPKELYIEGDKLVAVTKIVDTTIGEDMIKMYNEGLVNQHSIGFATIKCDLDNSTGIRTIKELKLYEGSAVLWGANPDTPTLEMMKSAEPEKVKKSLTDRLTKLAKAFRHGTFTDETFSLMEIEIEQIKQHIEALTTQPAKAVEPDGLKEFAEAINNFNNHFKK